MNLYISSVAVDSNGTHVRLSNGVVKRLDAGEALVSAELPPGGRRTLEQAVMDHFPARIDQLWSYDVAGIDWEDNIVLVTVEFVRGGKPEDYIKARRVDRAHPIPLDVFSLRVHCTFGRIEVQSEQPLIKQRSKKEQRA